MAPVPDLSVRSVLVGKEWPSCDWHHQFRLSIVLYVDDFRFAGAITRS